MKIFEVLSFSSKLQCEEVKFCLYLYTTSPSFFKNFYCIIKQPLDTQFTHRLLDGVHHFPCDVSAGTSGHCHCGAW